MKAKLIIDKKEIEIEISEEELNKIRANSKITGYERVKDNETYYTTTNDGNVNSWVECCRITDDGNYNGADYYSNRTLAQNNARADKLMRQLRRFAAEHREKDINYTHVVYEICYSHDNAKIKIEDIYDYKYVGTIPFDDRKTAELAIKTFKDELLWYFTEYKDSL